MKILIVEDEQKTAQMLKEFIEWHPTYTVMAICDSIEATVDYLRLHQNELDVIFMDIQLSDGQSFEIFDKIAVNLPVIFCTSYNEYTLKAFKNQGIDYILKPFNETDIRQSIAKVEAIKGRFVAHNYTFATFQEALPPKITYQTSFLIRLREKIYPVLISDIAFIYLENDVAHLYGFKGEKHPIFKTLDELENLISPEQFYRINRQMIINKKAIKEIEPYFNQKLVVHLTVTVVPEKILIPRLKIASFLAWIEGV